MVSVINFSDSTMLEIIRCLLNRFKASVAFQTDLWWCVFESLS